MQFIEKIGGLFQKENFLNAFKKLFLGFFGVESIYFGTDLVDKKRTDSKYGFVIIKREGLKVLYLLIKLVNIDQDIFFPTIVKSLKSYIQR